MASAKRKLPTNSENRRPEKKARKDEEGPQPVIPPSEQLFPRGGGGALTPLERRQIQAQATQDVLFEQETGQKIIHDEFGDEADVSASITKTTESKKSRSKTGTHNSRRTMVPKDVEAQVRIEGLSYKVGIAFPSKIFC